MKLKKRVLWVEDEAGHDMVQFIAPVIMDGGYDLIVAENASDGINQLLCNEFDAVIVDIRMPPGENEAWIKLYKKSDENKVSARLGLQFLYSILGFHKAKIKLGDKRPEWIKSDRVGVFSVESFVELDNDLNKLGIKNLYHKDAGTSETILLILIEEIIAQSTKPENRKR